MKNISNTIGLKNSVSRFWQCRKWLDWLIEQGLTSHQTHYRSDRGRFLQVIWPNQQCQSTEGNQLVFHTSVLLTVNIVSHNPARSSSDNIPS